FLYDNYQSFSDFQQNNSLEHLTINSCIDPLHFFSSIEFYKNLKVLNIENNILYKISKRIVIDVHDLPKLKKISLNSGNFTIIHIKFGEKNTELRELELPACNLPENWFYNISFNMHILNDIRSFSYFKNNLSLYDLYCVSFMNNCNFFDIFCCIFHNCRFSDIFTVNKTYKISELYIFGLNLNNHDIFAIRNLKLLTHICISIDLIPSSAIYLFKYKYFERLQSLDLSNNEPTININEESDLEEETTVVKEVEENA
ncbi:hypothetical protein CWI39_2602p0010, partial [Hamiltosporidium magnivora]